MNCMQKWSLNGFLAEMKRIHETMPDRRFVFILGAGASIESNVKGAASLAEEWMRIMFNREQKAPVLEFEQWLESNPLKIENHWDKSNLAACYPEIFEKCFEGDHESGYAELEKAIDNRSPSFGYAVLAWVLAQERHNMVITTNFDNLVADSLYIYGSKTPHVIGHESLAGYLKPMARRPMIAKIHRDLFTDPINDANGVSELHSQWSDALKNIFRFYTPIFIGYGGNDGSLMNFLGELDTQDISGRPFWCYYENGGVPNEQIIKLLKKHQGVLVPAPGFDQLMLEIGSAWGYNRRKQKAAVEKHTKRMLGTLDEKAKAIYNDSPEEVKIILRDNDSGEARDWLDWDFEASERESNGEKIAVYEKALKALPTSSELLMNLGIVYMHTGQFDKAKSYYYEALELAPDDIDIKCNLVHTLLMSGSVDEGLAMSESTLQLKPNNLNAISAHAIALLSKSTLDEKDKSNEITLKKAEQALLKVLSLGANRPSDLNNYAYFLRLTGEYEKAKENIDKAIELDQTKFYFYETLAEILWKTKDFDGALNALDKARQLNPDSPYGKELRLNITNEMSLLSKK